ncbi:MAG: HutD family protein [Pseudomonas oryzihabitans]
MSTCLRLPAADYQRMPWRNGLGSTLEIARDTPADDFGWRLSLADVTQSGDFSPFAGMTRIISVIEGAGMRLLVDGIPTPALGRWQAFVFSGDARVSCELLDGPIRDFNLIYRADRYQAELAWIPVEGSLQLEDRRTLLLFCAQGSVVIRSERESVELGTLDALHLPSGPIPARLTIQGSAQLCVIRLRTRAPAA